MPLSTSSRMRSPEAVAGPSVHTIFVRRFTLEPSRYPTALLSGICDLHFLYLLDSVVQLTNSGNAFG